MTPERCATPPPPVPGRSTTRLDRRRFLAGAGLLASGAMVPGGARAGEPASPPVAAPVARRPLGKSGLEVSVVSLGSAGGQDPHVIRFALERGLNFVHTATGYAGGNAIRAVADAIRGRRDQVLLGLKITWTPGDLAKFDAALAQLGTDHVDIGFFNIHRGDAVRDPRYREAAAALKRAGKVRAIGLTSHQDVPACLAAALDEGFYDALMPAYTIAEEADFRPVFERAARDGVGVILMKTARGLGGADYRRAVPRYLATPGVTTIVKGLASFEAIEQQVADAAAAPAPADAARLDAVARVSLAGRCHLCGACARACPRGFAVADVVRCSDYYLEHSDLYACARETYAALARPTAEACAGCDACERACPHGVPVRHHLRRATMLLA